MDLFSEYKGLRKENYVLFFGRMVTNMGAMIWSMMTMILNLKMGYNATETALVIVCGGLLILPAILLGGRLADRYSKKWIIIICDSISVSFYIVCGLIPLSNASIVLIIIAAAFQQMEGPAYNSLVADLNPTADRQRAYSLLYLGANIGYVLSPTIAGFLFKDYLWLAFIISGVAIGMSTVLIFFFLKDITPVTEVTDDAAYQKSREGESLISVLKDNIPVVIFMFSFMIYDAVYGQFSYLMPLDLGRMYGENGALTVGTMTSVNCVLVIIFTPIVTKYMKKVRDVRKCCIGNVLQTLGFVVFFVFMTRTFSYYTATVLLTFCEILWAIAKAPYYTARMPESHRGRMEGLSQTMGMLALGVSEFVTGRLYDSTGSNGAWTFTFIVCGIGLVLIFTAMKLDRKKYPKLYD